MAFGPFLRTHYISFCDNEAAKHALLKGYGKDECINNMLGMFWTNCATAGRSPWFERVTSEANLSDEISRDNMQLVKQSGWNIIDLELTETYKILIGAAKDIVVAHREAADLTRTPLEAQARTQLLTCTWAHEVMSDDR